MASVTVTVWKGGKGSGFRGHEGRPGKVGGSQAEGSPTRTPEEDAKHQAYLAKRRARREAREISKREQQDTAEHQATVNEKLYSGLGKMERYHIRLFEDGLLPNYVDGTVPNHESFVMYKEGMPESVGGEGTATQCRIPSQGTDNWVLSHFHPPFKLDPEPGPVRKCVNDPDLAPTSTGSSFSHSDLAAAISGNFKEFRIFTYKENRVPIVYRFIRPEGGWNIKTPMRNGVRKPLYKLANDVKRMYVNESNASWFADEYKPYRSSPNQFTYHIQTDTINKICKKYGFIYKEEEWQ